MLATVLTLAACAGPPVATDVALRPNPNPRAPLAEILSFTADRPVVPSITIDDGEHREMFTPDPEVRHFDDYPAEYPPGAERAAANVAGDDLIEFRLDGTTVRRWSILDVLDPYRIGQGSLDPASSSDCSATRSAGASRGHRSWPCHQHGVERTPRGTWLLYDNGGSRSFPPDKGLEGDARYSRAVEYRVDEAARTVEEVWTYGPKEEWFMSSFISDADPLPETGNVLIADGGRIVGADGEQMTDFGGRHRARVLEVTYEGKEKVWEMVIDDPARPYSIYRAQRLRSLYPKLDRPTG